MAGEVTEDDFHALLDNIEPPKESYLSEPETVVLQLATLPNSQIADYNKKAMEARPTARLGWYDLMDEATHALSGFGGFEKQYKKDEDGMGGRIGLPPFVNTFTDLVEISWKKEREDLVKAKAKAKAKGKATPKSKSKAAPKTKRKNKKKKGGDEAEDDEDEETEDEVKEGEGEEDGDYENDDPVEKHRKANGINKDYTTTRAVNITSRSRSKPLEEALALPDDFKEPTKKKETKEGDNEEKPKKAKKAPSKKQKKQEEEDAKLTEYERKSKKECEELKINTALEGHPPGTTGYTKAVLSSLRVYGKEVAVRLANDLKCASDKAVKDKALLEDWSKGVNPSEGSPQKRSRAVMIWLIHTPIEVSQPIMTAWFEGEGKDWLDAVATLKADLKAKKKEEKEKKKEDTSKEEKDKKKKEKKEKKKEKKKKLSTEEEAALEPITSPKNSSSSSSPPPPPQETVVTGAVDDM